MTMRAVEVWVLRRPGGPQNGDANPDHEGKYSEAELKLLVNTAAYDASEE